jgi:hypothetical protein
MSHRFVDDPIPAPRTPVTSPVLRKPFCRGCGQEHDSVAGMFSLVRYRGDGSVIRLGLFCDETCLEVSLERGRPYPRETS